MKKDLRLYIEHILECIDKILSYTRNMNEDEFLRNDLVKDAVVKNFEVIGEATKNIPDDFKAAHPGIPWKNMAGMRDKLIHDYAGIDYWKVWDSVIMDIPKIKQVIEKI